MSNNNTLLGKFVNSGELGRTLDSFAGIFNGILGNSTSAINGTVCPNGPTQLMEALAVPLFIILPAIIIIVAIAIKKIGFITAWIPKWTGPFFDSFRPDESDNGWGWNSGGGYPSPQQSTGYAASNTNSRQTEAVLNAIEEFPNKYAQEDVTYQQPKWQAYNNNVLNSQGQPLVAQMNSNYRL